MDEEWSASTRKSKRKYVNEVIDGNQVESEFYEKKNMKSKLYAR